MKTVSSPLRNIHRHFVISCVLAAGLLIAATVKTSAQSAGPGYALSFNGTNSSAAVPNIPLTCASGPGVSQYGCLPTRTIEAWVNIGALPATRSFILTLGDPSSYQSEIWVLNSNGTLQIGSSDNFVTIPGPPVGVWMHIATVFQYTTTTAWYFIYTNGIYATNLLQPDVDAKGRPLLLGQPGAGVTGANFTGTIDECRIWNITLTQSQIAQTMSRSLVGNESGLVGYWRFDEGSGSTTADSTVDGLTMTLTNITWVTSTAPVGAPVVTTTAASGLASSSATLNGVLGPNFQNTGFYFQYGTSTNYSSVTPWMTIPGSSSPPVPVSALIKGLTQGTLYHFELVATNGGGTDVGGDQTFTPPTTPPVVTTLAVSGLTATSATLNGTVDPGALDSVAWFQYGTTTNYGNTSPPFSIAGSNVTPVPENYALSGLAPGTVYHFQLVATNTDGASTGADLAFSTSAPSATTSPASSIGPNSGTLNGSVTTSGEDTVAWFQYGATTNYGTGTSLFTVGGTNSTVPVSVPLNGLAANTMYHFQLFVTNSAGSNAGGDLTFNTLLGTNNALSSLTLNSGTLSPAFSPGAFTYTAGLSNNVNSVTATATSADAGALIEMAFNNGPYGGGGTGSFGESFGLSQGFNPIAVKVTSQDGSSSNIYTITVAACGSNVVVTTTNASGPGSLANAITLVNACAGPHVITLANNTVYKYTTVNNFWYGPNALPPIASQITIEGNGATLQNLNAAALRFFYVGADSSQPGTLGYNSPGPGNLTLHNLVLFGGIAQGGSGGGAGMGGAIFNQGILVLNAVTVVSNRASGGGGGPGGGGMGNSSGFGGPVTPAGSQGAPGAPPYGGGGGGGFGTNDNAIAGVGGGVASGLGGAGAGGRLNYGNGGGGGGYGNTASSAGGTNGGNFGFAGLDAQGQGVIYAGWGGGGGGVGGGGGPGAATDFYGLTGLFDYGGGGGGGFGGGGGGARSSPDGQYTGAGGNGGFGGGGGWIAGNGGFGGGDAGCSDSSHQAGGGAGMGGAIFNHNGVVALTNSTFAFNSAVGGTGPSTNASAGNYFCGGGGSGYGAAIFNLNGKVMIVSSTLASNSVSGGIAYFRGGAAGGALFHLTYDSALSRTGAVLVVNSILAGTLGGPDLAIAQPANTTAGTNLGLTVLSASEPNLIQSFTNSGGSFTNTGVITNAPLLGPLGNYGGPTPTMSLLPGSPAIDAGDDSAAPATDQRGFPRISGAHVDLGAFEVQPPPPVIISTLYSNTGQFQIQFNGDPSLGYSVLEAPNLSLPLNSWSVLGPATFLSNNLFQFTDPQASNYVQRFYIIRHP